MPSLFDKEPFWWTVTSWPHCNLSQTHNVISNPPLLVGVGAEDGEMTARRLYISWPGHLSNYSTANLYIGRVNRLWGRGPKTRAPRCEGEEAAYSTLGQEHCPKKQRQPCSEGHTKGPVWIPRSSVHVGTRVPQCRDERVLQGDLQPREPLD